MSVSEKSLTYSAGNESTLLKRLLQTLVEEWGHEAVAACLDQVSRRSGLAVREASTRRQADGRRRLTPSERVAKLKTRGRKRQFLKEAALRFEEKRFLPSISDVRDFLHLHGEFAGELKQREPGFARVLRVLQRIPTQDLENILRENQFSGPSRLGPLSEAIESASSALRAAERSRPAE